MVIMSETEVDRPIEPGSIPLNKFDPQLDKDLVTKAINALLKYHEKQVANLDKKQLLGEDSTIQVQFTLEVPPVKQNPKPLRLLIPYEIYKVSDESEGENLEEPEVCLIVKDDAKPWLQEMIQKFPQQMGHIKKVLTLDSLRKKHKEFKQRRVLMSRYSIFMADDRIVPMLMNALGKKFWEAKKHPIPIRITRKDSLPQLIRSALRATYITLNTGTCLTSKGGFTGMPVHKLVDNCLAIANEVAEKVPRGWANIRSIGVRTPDSALLPIYNKAPEQLEEIARLAGLPLVYVDEEPNETADPESPETKKKRKLESKSPLLKALKKQRKSEKSGNEAKTTCVDGNDTEGSKSTALDADDLKQSKKANKKRNKTGTETETGTDGAISVTKKKRKGVQSAVCDGEKNSQDDKSKKSIQSEDAVSGKVDSKDDNDVQSSGKSKKKKIRESSLSKREHEDFKTESKAKQDETSTPKKRAGSDKPASGSAEGKKQKPDKTKQSSSTSEAKGSLDGKKKDEFILAKSFSGSKKGYVFKMGNQGLGYYFDVKPNVDKEALDAILRAAEQRRAKGNEGNRRRSSTGKRRGRF
ncbi:hypothetical protein ACA910_000151 [Epithemia clementina (nom. ined.)]